VRGLYAIVDLDALGARGLDPIAFAESVLAARPAALQLRAKQRGAGETARLLGTLGARCRSNGVPLFANDRPDLAVLAGADGVHLGQTDLLLSEARRFADALGARLAFGVSTHDAAQLEQALAERPDYVAFGPVFGTRSKAQPDPVVGLDGLERAARTARAAGVPLVAIGGIDRQSAPAVARLADAAAVIAALIPEDGDLARVTERARELHALLGGA
jgi:thiamine-phosphate pyrophosphorylase